MQLSHGSEMPFEPFRSEHRAGTLAFKFLLKGDPGTPENYSLSLARQQGSFFAPRHRHNFDQFRMALVGDFSMGAGRELKEGEIGYFPEGTLYGPQDDKDGDRELLVLQFGGASGAGYLDQAALKRASEELKTKGRFEAGHFVGPDGARKDGYEAIWEHVNGRPLRYPQRRYTYPVFMRPANFAYRQVDGAPGASRKLLGIFSERETRLEMVKLEAGARFVAGNGDAIVIVFVLEGNGSLGEVAYARHTALEVAPDKQAVLNATKQTEMIVITLPMIGDRRQAAA